MDHSQENEFRTEVCDTLGVNPCRNCGECLFVEDYARGDIICQSCGCVDDVLVVDTRGYQPAVTTEVVTQAPVVPPRFRRASRVVHSQNCSLPYKRITYFNERLTQWTGHEPEIPLADAEAIVKHWKRWAPCAYPADWQYKCDKGRIRAVLNDLDTIAVKSGEPKRFVQKYLEKWLTIRTVLVRVPSTGKYATEELLQHLREQFVRLQGPFDRIVKDRIGRHSLLNYNFIIRRLLDLNGASWMGVDFPPLKTTAKRQRLIEMWKMICDALEWPYINNDHLVFSWIPNK